MCPTGRTFKGFTLVELMVVLLIVAILAAVAIPLYSGRIDSSKWTEADAAAGTIRTAVRTYWSQMGGASYTGDYGADLSGGVATFDCSGDGLRGCGTGRAVAGGGNVAGTAASVRLGQDIPGGAFREAGEDV